MKIPRNTGKKREKKYFGISRFSLERVSSNSLITNSSAWDYRSTIPPIVVIVN